MAKIIVDVEANGPCPGLYSMVSFGAVLMDKDGNFTDTFYGEVAPLPGTGCIPEALAVSGVSEQEHAGFDAPNVVMLDFLTWVESAKEKTKSKRAYFLSDNNGFDWQFINYYFHRYCGKNPFGHSSSNISDLYKGMRRSMFENFKRLRKTKHTHHPVDDATGNAEALLAMMKMGLKIGIK